MEVVLLPPKERYKFDAFVFDYKFDAFVWMDIYVV